MSINVVCAMEQRIGMIRICNLQYAGSAQLHITGNVCPGFTLYWMIKASVILLVLLLMSTDGCILFFSFVRVFSSDIPFETKEGPNGYIFQRAWDGILRDRILIYCMYVDSNHLCQLPTVHEFINFVESLQEA